MFSRTVVILLAVIALSAALIAHEDRDPHSPYPRPSYSGGGSVPFTSNGVQLMSWLTVGDFDPTFTSGNDCWGYTSPSGREYALMGLSGGTAFVEVTDPGAPVIVDVQAGPTSLWRDIKVYQDHAYAVSEGGSGIQVFDMSQIDSGTVIDRGDFAAGGCTDASHNVAINEDTGFLYRLGGDGSPCSGGPQGIVAYSLANPDSPSFVGEWHDRYVHDGQVVLWDVAGPWFGHELAFCAADNTSGGGTPSLYVVDVTNKASMVTIGSMGYTNSSFCHQLWLSADKHYAYLDDELDEQNFGFNTRTRIVDVSDPTSPSFVGFFSSGSTSIDHNLYVVGNRIYESNYRSGLRIFDATNPLSPTQIAWFDTYPEDDNASFNSLWNNYPFFPSGTVIGSDLEKGLFVWYVGAPLLSFDFVDGLPDLVSPAGDTELRFQVNEATPGDLMGGTVQLHVDAGAGFVTQTATPLGGGLFSAAIPPSSCGDQIRFYVSARSTNDYTWTDPPAGPTQVYMTTSGLLRTMVYSDDVEIDRGWTVGAAGDDATTGIWTRVNPIGTSAQPEDDHTPDPGTFAWVTGQGSVGGSVGENDVDGGTTTLLSPVLNASGLGDPMISYWRWYSNNAGSAPGEDVFVVDISSNGGSSWTNLETVGPTGADTVGGWIQHSARIADFVTPTNQIRLRFRASDLINGSIVEAAVDDVEIVDLVCSVNVTNVSPSSGPIDGGNIVTITGEGFVSGVTTCTIGSNPAQVVSVASPTQMLVRVPPSIGTRSGKLGHVPRNADVTVTTGAGSATLADGYTYAGLPSREISLH